MSEIRLRNETGVALGDVRLVRSDEPRGQVALGPLPPGAVSRWRHSQSVQRYPAVEASGPGTELVHLPYEGTDQPSLPEGRYTYVLRLDSGRLVVDLEREPD